MSEDLLHSDLTELLTLLGIGDHARPQSPHEVFQKALGVLRKRLVDLDAEIADRRQAVCDYRASARVADNQIATLVGEVQRLSGSTVHMRHVKTHGYYDVLAHGAQMQCAFPVSDYDKVTVYRGADGTI